MAGGGAAFSQTLQSQDETNMGSGEPVVRYGTGGRITGFDKGEIRSLARFGQNGDTILAHINPQEARMLKRMGGSGTINPITGLPQFDIGDDDFSSISLEGGGGGGGDYGGGFDLSGSYDFGGDNGFGGGSNDIAPYDPYTDEGPNQGGSPEVGIDYTLPDAGIVEIVDDRPSNFTPYDDDIPEIIIPDTRPPGEITPFDFGPDDILIPVTYEPDDIPEIIIPAPRPPGPEPTEITPLEFDPAPEPTWEFDPEPEPDIPEIIIPAPRPPGPEPVEITPFDFDPAPEPDPFEPVPAPVPVPVPVPEPEFDPAPQPEPAPEPAPDPSPDPAPEPEFDPVPEPIFIPVPVPFYAPTPIFLPSPAPYYAPTPVTAPAPRQGIYRSQYQNYANPLTMFNVSNYGQDVPTSPGYNYATAPGNMGINQLNQNLRDMASRQMAQTYPDGSPKGADMNQVLAEMRRVGLTATDLENAYYGRTTGLNTPFSVYGKTPPMQTPFSFTDVQQPQQMQAPQSVQQKQVTMSNGIFDLIKKLPT
jgi:hypothetical protein